MSKKDYSELSKEQLIELVEKLESKKKYGLVWDEERVPEKVVTDCKENLPVLTEVKDREIHTSDDEPTHILIEGDNYHAMSVLNYTHAGKIDLIYIDPPYNTGAEDWKYNNNYVDKNDTWRHSKWLQMMKERLLLAVRLLSETGILCITIDDYELHHLQGLIETHIPNTEIVGVVVIKNSPSGRPTVRGFRVNHEYAVFVAKDKNAEIGKLEKSIEQLNLFKEIDDIGSFQWANLRKRGGANTLRQARPKQFYPIYVSEEKIRIPKMEWLKEERDWKILEETEDDEEIVFPIGEDGKERIWSLGNDTARNELQNFEVRRKNGKTYVFRKLRLEDKGSLPSTFWENAKYSVIEHGTVLLEKILGKTQAFPFPKSLYAVIDCLKVAGAENKKAIVLDFFAGSGTTGHAVIELNKKDGGSRQFILCTNNENGICDEITFPRIHNVIKGYDFSGKVKELLLSVKLNLSELKKIDETFEEIESIKSKNELTQIFEKIIVKVESGILNVYGENVIDDRKKGLGSNLKYFKTSFVKSGENKDQLRIDITKRCTEMLCLKEGIYKLKKENGDWKIFEEKDKYLAVYYDFPHASLDELRDEMNLLDGEKVLYCFTVDPNGLEKEDFSDWENIRLEPIPQKILDVYKDIF